MGYLDGFKVTFKKLFEERVTTEYPKEKPPSSCIFMSIGTVAAIFVMDAKS